MGQESDGAQTKKSDRHHQGVLLERHRDLLHLRGRAASHGERQGRPVLDQFICSRNGLTNTLDAPSPAPWWLGHAAIVCCLCRVLVVWSLRCACLVAAVWPTRGKSSATLVCLLLHAVRAGCHSSEVVQRTSREADSSARRPASSSTRLTRKSLRPCIDGSASRARLRSVQIRGPVVSVVSSASRLAPGATGPPVGHRGRGALAFPEECPVRSPAAPADPV